MSTRAIFNSTSAYKGYPGYKEYSGYLVEVIRQLTEKEVEFKEVGNMYRVVFANGTRIDAFEDELEWL